MMLRSITTTDLNYLKPLKNLWSLDIKLGGIKNLWAIEGMKGIKYLELWKILGLTDIGVISSLSGLQYLFLQSLRRVVELPDFRRLPQLRRLHLEDMKGLCDLSALAGVPALEEFVHVQARQGPKEHQPLLQNITLKSALVGFGSASKNQHFADLLRAHGIEQYQWKPFAFV